MADLPAAGLGALAGLRRGAAAVPHPGLAALAVPVTGRSEFATLFTRACAGDLQFTGHARTRLKSRGLELNPERMLRLTHGVAQAAAKGARASLVLLDQLALVVSIPNRTVITAMDTQHLKDFVFTNIDSAVIA